MRPEYAPNGLVGLLTPQANTTVEPEFSVLMPDGVAWLNGRITSSKPTIRERLIDYMDHLPAFSDQFGNAPLEALALGCTGTAYFVGAPREDELLKAVADRMQIPVFSAATALTDALNVLDAKSIILVSPYDGDINAACGPYWESRGFRITRKVQATGESGFHPIYSLHSNDADAALSSLDTNDADAIVILGTGMPTLASLTRLNRSFAIPVLSCMSSLGWRAASVLDPSELSADRVIHWARGDDWQHKLANFNAGQ